MSNVIVYIQDGKALLRDPGAMRSPHTRDKGPDPNMHAMAEILEVVTQAPIRKRSITNHAVLNEAYDYA